MRCSPAIVRAVLAVTKIRRSIVGGRQIGEDVPQLVGREVTQELLVLNAFVTAPMLNEMTAAGGVILMGLAVSSLLEIKKIRTGNFLPALAVAPLIVWILSTLGI